MKTEELDRRTAVTKWWDKKGYKIWNNRVTLSDFAGHKVIVLRFEKAGQRYMYLVTIRQQEGLLTAKVAGLFAEEDECVNTFRSGPHQAKSFPELLHTICVVS